MASQLKGDTMGVSRPGKPSQMRATKPVGFALTAIAALVLTAVPGVSSAAGQVIPREAITARAQFGWPTDAATIASLAAGKDVGLASWGIAMTQAEEQELLDRMTFETAVAKDVLPFLNALPTLGGLWIDSTHGGRLIVQLTKADQDIIDSVVARLPARTMGVEFRTVGYSEQDLRAAAHGVEAVWAKVGGPAVLLGTTVDIPNNRIVLRFDKDNLAAGIAAAVKVQDALDVPVATSVDIPDHDTSCTVRSNCWDPILKAGAWIFEHGVPSPYGNICTMGFHIQLANDEQFVTAGHCGIYNRSYADWWQTSASGVIGNELENLIESDGRDIMRVSMADSRASNQVFGETKVVFGWTWPLTGQAIKVSLGWGSNTIKTGTVTDAYSSWTSDVCGCTVWGADASWTTLPGDSGSPVYNVSGNYLNAIGTNSNASGHFAEIGDMFTYGSGGGIFVP